MPGRFETADGIRLYLDIEGTGTPFFFQHGLCGDASQTSEVFPNLVNYQRITLDCRGHGQSDSGPAEGLTIAQFSEDFAHLYKALNPGLSVFGGISMGAALALKVAVSQPQRVKALIVARPAWLAASAPINLEPYGYIGDLLSKYDRQTARQLFEASHWSSDLAFQAPANLASLRSFFNRTPFAVTAALLSRIPRDGPMISEDDIAKINVPTLVIGHDRDLAHPLTLAKRIAELVPTSRFVEITPKATDEQKYRDEFRAAIHDFLKEL